MKHNLDSRKANLAIITAKLAMLHECVLALKEVHPSEYLVKAEAQIEAALLLRRINFDVMLSICNALESFKAIAPGGVYNEAANLIIEADNVLFDLPIPFVTAEDVNHG